VLDEGKRKPSGGIVLVRATGEPGLVRYGLIVSRSVGNAVARNRAKRRLRHTVKGAHLQPGMDYVIIARKSVLDAPFETLQRWLSRAATEVQDA
jgi:ribonuclease P protein component